jgi:hypothetical protein
MLFGTRRLTMAATMRNEETELAHRASNGIEVSLVWNRGTNRVTVRVFDARAEDGFELAVDRRSALDAYRHPFAYDRCARRHLSRARPAGEPTTSGAE